MPLLIYFAYGSNLCYQRLSARIGTIQCLGNARLPQYALYCNKIGKDSSGKCNLVQHNLVQQNSICALDSSHWDCVDLYCHDNQHVWGVLYAMSAQQKSRLDQYEGVGHGYQDFNGMAIDSTGKAQSIFSYRADDFTADATIKPYNWYMDYVLTGAKTAQFPPHYIAQLARIPTCVDTNNARYQHNQAILAQLRDTDHDNQREWSDFRPSVE